MPTVSSEPRFGFGAVVLRAGDAEAEVLPERGGIVTRWRQGDDELLYVDPATVSDRSKNVRGGIPLLFPIAGRVKGPLSFEGKAIALQQHGFARQRAFTVRETTADDATARVAMSLISDPESRRVFDFDFTLEVVVTLEAAALTLELTVHNTGAGRMPLHLGLHPYFRVPVEAKSRAKVRLTGTRALDLLTDQVAPYQAPRLDGPEVNLHLLDPAPFATLDRANGTTVQLDCTESFGGMVVWTLPGQPFVCVEPWSAPVDTFGQAWLEPGQRASYACALTARRVGER